MQKKGDPADLASTLHHDAQTAVMFFEASYCSIFAINPITLHFTASQTVAEREEGNENVLSQPYPEQLVQQTLARGSIQIDDLDERPEYQNLFTQVHNIRSFIAYPLRIQHNQKPLGVLCLYFKKPGIHFSEEKTVQKAFHAFLTQASFLLQQTWLLRRHQEVALIGQEINQEPSDIDTLFEKLRTLMRLPIRQIQMYLQTIHGLFVSSGEIVELQHRLVAHFQPRLQALKTEIQASPAIQADETGWREDALNGYIWSLSTRTVRHYEYHHSHAGKVVKQF